MTPWSFRDGDCGTTDRCLYVSSKHITFISTSEGRKALMGALANIGLRSGQDGYAGSIVVIKIDLLKSPVLVCLLACEILPVYLHYFVYPTQTSCYGIYGDDRMVHERELLYNGVLYLMREFHPALTSNSQTH